ncbi:MAG: hypothetical protein U1E76_05805 [Planctomycetota bacterium]
MRVARTTLFVHSASHALLEQFRRERDPSVRAATVLAAVSGDARIAQSDDVATLVREATHDAAVLVQDAAVRAQRSLDAARVD